MVKAIRQRGSYWNGKEKIGTQPATPRIKKKRKMEEWKSEYDIKFQLPPPPVTDLLF